MKITASASRPWTVWTFPIRSNAQLLGSSVQTRRALSSTSLRKRSATTTNGVMM